MKAPTTPNLDGVGGGGLNGQHNVNEQDLDNEDLDNEGGPRGGLITCYPRSPGTVK